jgi:hypothetical protein
MGFARVGSNPTVVDVFVISYRTKLQFEQVRGKFTKWKIDARNNKIIQLL